jgi:Mg/Co/Ni transporter MgtE
LSEELNLRGLREALSSAHPVDLAEALADVSLEERVRVFNDLFGTATYFLIATLLNF